MVAAGGKLADGERPDDDVPFETPCAYLPTRKGFGALLSRDLCTWEDISGSISVPIEYKHGTGLHLQGKALRQVCRNGPFANTSVCESL